MSTESLHRRKRLRSERKFIEDDLPTICRHKQ